MIKFIISIIFFFYVSNALANGNITIYGAESRFGSSIQYILAGCYTDGRHTKYRPGITSYSAKELKSQSYATIIDVNSIHKKAVRSSLIELDLSNLQENNKYIYNIHKKLNKYEIWLEQVDTGNIVTDIYPVELKGTNFDGTMKTLKSCKNNK
jgi:hypothetical protein